MSTDVSQFTAQPGKRAPLSGTHSYYRSKLFTAETDLNSLIAAAAPLFSLIGFITTLPTRPDINQLHQDLCHEIKSFEHLAQQQGYRSQLILAARYCLCALIDEVIQTSPWGETSTWSIQNLLTTFHGEASGS